MIRALPGLLLLGACAPPIDPQICEGEAPAVTLTPGDDATADLVPGQATTLVHGPQGGWHVLFGVRVIDPDPRVELDVVMDAPEGRVVDNHYRLRLDHQDGCVHTVDDLFGFIDVSGIDPEARVPDLLHGEALTLAVTVHASQGIATDQVELIGERDPVDEPD